MLPRLGQFFAASCLVPTSSAASNSAEQSPSTQPAFLPLGLAILKLWKSVCSEKANAGTGVQPTFAVSALNRVSCSEVGLGLSYRRGGT